MTGDLERRLRDRARSVEHLVQPPPVEQIRRRGNRRRRRRQTVLAATAVVAALAGGFGVRSLFEAADPAPPVATPATASPGPPRATPTPTDGTEPPPNPITRSDLLSPSEAPWPEQELQEVVTSVGIGRSPDLLSACFPDDGPTGLGAGLVLSRGFGYGTGPTGDRSLYTAILQFGSVPAAREAYGQVRGWSTGCPVLLAERGLDPEAAGVETRTVRDQGRTVGEVSRVAYRPTGAAGPPVSEAVGTARVRDRVVLVVTRAGNDQSATEASRQAALLRAAADRLR